MKKLIFSILFFAALTVNAQIIYKEGMKISSNNTYLFERGKEYTASITGSVDNVTFAAVGEGNLPVLNGYISLAGSNNKISNLKIISPKKLGIPAALRLMKGENCEVNNVIIEGGQPGLNIALITGQAKLSNIKVSKSVYDGLYISNNDTLIIKNIKVDDMYVDETNDNLTKSIDNIHFENNKLVLIDSVFSDHSKYEGKFALIINGYDSVSIKNSTFIGHSNSAAVYTGGGSKYKYKWYIENSYMSGLYGLWSHSKVLYSKNNIFNNCTTGITDGGDQYINNCVFINNNIAAKGSKIKECNNSIFYNCNAVFYSKNGSFADNNCYYPEPVTTESLGVNYIIEDPLLDENYLSNNPNCVELGLNKPDIIVITDPCQKFIEELRKSLENLKLEINNLENLLK